jgi:hypothetical protein
MGGALAWIEDKEKGLVIFTRGSIGKTLPIRIASSAIG